MNTSEPTLADLQVTIRQFCDDRNWDQFHNAKDLSISLSLEAAELLEHFQWKNEAEVSEHIKANKSEVSEEIADTLYWVLLIANKLDINLVDAFSAKMAKNNLKYPIDKAKNSHKKYSEL